MKSLKRQWVKFFLFLIVAFFISQSFFSNLSYIVLIFLVLLPVFSFLYMLVLASFVSCKLSVSKTIMRKGEKFSYTIEFHNQSFFMAPFVCAELILPDSKGIRIFRKRMIFPLLPFENRKIQTTVSFKYRGLYPIRIETVRLTDVFGLFALRIPCNRQYTILTLPNTSLSEIGKIADGTDNDTTTKKTLFGNDKIEMTDVRNYLPGDSLKLVHWKLSSRHDDMIVKVFDQPADNKASVLVDFSAVVPGVDERNEMSADAVAEIAASICKGCTESGYEACLLYTSRCV